MPFSSTSSFPFFLPFPSPPSIVRPRVPPLIHTHRPSSVRITSPRPIPLLLPHVHRPTVPPSIRPLTPRQPLPSKQECTPTRIRAAYARWRSGRVCTL
jgi:hypothetical protein